MISSDGPPKGCHFSAFSAVSQRVQSVKQMNRNNLIRFVVLLLFAFDTGCGGQKPLTAAEVIQNAERLDGKTIRVRGMAYLWIDPSQAAMWMFVGTLQVNEDSELILQNIDLEQSSQLVDGKWLPISTGNFDVMFP